MSERALRYVTTRADHVAELQLYASRTSAARWFPPSTYAVIVGLSWFSAWLFYVRQGDKNQAYLASALLALSLTVSLPWLYRRYQDNFFKSLLTDDNLRGLVGPVELTIDNDRIEEKNALSTVKARWAAIGSVEDSDDHVIIRVAPLLAILIPHRAFESHEARHEFLAFIRARLAICSA